MGEAALFDVIEGAIELGVKYLSAYAFSTENWKRSPDEVRWLMGFNRDVIHRRRDQFVEMGVRVRWAGRRPRLWRSVINELEIAERMSRHNDLITLQFCVNYGGRAELADAFAAMAADVEAGKAQPGQDQREDHPPVPVLPGRAGRGPGPAVLGRAAAVQLPDLAGGVRGVRPLDTLWPDFDRRHFWYGCELFAQRDRRFGGASPTRSPRRPLPTEAAAARRVDWRYRRVVLTGSLEGQE
jgi:Undecaprenyl pyrophosphate synthase